MGIFVADAVFQTARLPEIGETLLCNQFNLGPGGKGSNQAVAAARAGAETFFITKLGSDAFASMAIELYSVTGVKTVIEHSENLPTGVAFVHVNQNTGDNAIVVAPGAATTIDHALINRAASTIESASVFITQLEQSVEAAEHALQIARSAGVTTILNPAPAQVLPDSTFQLCDYITPNQTETTAYTGIKVETVNDARAAGDALLSKGVGTALITLGDQGALLHNNKCSNHIPAFSVDNVVDTTGAGDAFNAAFAAALSAGEYPDNGAQFACAAAALSITREGASNAMPRRDEILTLLHS